MWAAVACASIALAGCGSSDSARSPNSTVSSDTRKTVPIKRRSNKELNRERTWWETVSSVISSHADRAHGVSVGIGEHPSDQANREYYLVPENMKATDINDAKNFAVPNGWNDVHDALLEVINSVNDNIEVIQKAHDGDEDAARAAISQAESVRRNFCSALAAARRHYAAEGGRANDLSLFYVSETGDWHCVLIDDPKPRVGTILRKTVGIDSFETFTGVGGQSASGESQDNIIHDMGVRLIPGDSVTVRERRRDFDEEAPPELCRSSVMRQKKQFWIACQDIKF